jgi:molecular chaperone DnaK
MASDNNTLGRFRLDGIPGAPRGIPQIEVTFDIDANGILNVNAKDKATGKEQSVTITASTNLDKGDVERMVEESKAHEAEDQQRKEFADARNAGDSLAYQTEKTLNELGDKVPEGDRESIEGKVSELREALEGDDIERIKQLTEEVQQASHALSQQLYAQEGEGDESQPQPEAEAEGGSAPSGEEEGDVVEGEFREA